jgi:hypothetical protein
MFVMYILQIKVSDLTYFCLKTAIWYAVFHKLFDDKYVQQNQVGWNKEHNWAEMADLNKYPN